MITRYALFEGQVHPGQNVAFREAVLTEILPKWKAFPGALAVRVTFAESRDDGAPEFPMILAISYPDLASVDAALAAPCAARPARQPQRCWRGFLRAHPPPCDHRARFRTCMMPCATRGWISDSRVTIPTGV